MSDDDFMLEDDDVYSFDYSEDESDDPDVELQNTYYSAKAIMEEDEAGAISEFYAVVKAEEEKGDWGFKALRHIVQLEIKLKRYDDALSHYRELLTYIKSAVTRDDARDGVSLILDAASSITDAAQLQSFYEVTLSALKEAKNERLWMTTMLRLANLKLEREEHRDLTNLIAELREACAKDGNAGNQMHDNNLLEVYALEIQMLTREKKTKKLKELYQQCLTVRAAIPHPRTMGIIRECGGKMHMTEQEWEKAQTDFFESFKNYDEAGSKQRIQVLKYLVLASMLTESQINPFDSQETKPYKSDPQIQAMTDLVNAYQHKEIHEFERILSKNKESIMGDPFIEEYIADVLRTIRTQVLLELIRPYTRIDIGSIAQQLNITSNEVEELLIGLVLDGKIDGRIDQVSQRLELKRNDTDREKYAVMAKWAESLGALQLGAFNQVSANV
ncbi:PCI domain-containing protein [Thamnocephalis sphaerospora]|uniref:COP9 signalosome complex subunit 2 n=1 Tax=Thamnocephalis sphaerospora TaxID=78915 RepID=A0A4P9XX41_9FUNG|nr:PCI domain-containing protein [Thamnocephalis sphaerospora]|eukprot:RKP10241.1 PCI domain-containing protein [Thamnocephalis sphaerospora]